MFLDAFKTTFGAIMELVFLGAVGFFIAKRGFLKEDGVKVLSDLVIGLFLPCFMFIEIIRRFTFSLYPEWWIFPIYSIFITFVGYAVGSLVLFWNKSLQKNAGEFLGIATFQNSGYLPLPLVAALLAPAAAQEMFILIFLFLLGFNMTIFSLGVMMLASKGKDQQFDYKHMFNAPVVATLFALICVFFKVNTFLPSFVERPVDILGRCAIPLSILVVGGNLAALKNHDGADLKPVGLALVIKLIIVPLIFLGFVLLAKPKPLVGLLIMLQAAMPPAALLSVITKKHNHEGRLVNQAIFYGHMLSIGTIPLILALYWALAGKLF